MADITDNIRQARQAGYSDDEITKFLSGDSIIGPKVNEALGQGHASKDILDYLTTPIAPNPNPTQAQINPPLSVGDAGKQILHGFGAGAVEAGRGLVNLGGKAIGMPPIPPSNFEQGIPGKIVQSNDQGISFTGGKIAEKAAELFAPGALINKGVKAAGEAASSGGGAVKALAELSTRGLGEFGNMYASDRLHGATHEEAMDNAKYAGLIGAGLEGLGSVFKAIKPESVYKSSGIISKIPDKVGLDQIDEIIKQAVDDKIPITKGGLDKINQLNAGTMAERNAYLAQHANDPVDINLITAPVGELYQKASNVGDTALMEKITKLQDDLLSRYGAKPATPGSPGTPATQQSTGVLGPNGQPVMKTVPGAPGTPGTPAVKAQLTVAEAENVKESFHELLAEYYKHLSADPTKNKIQALEASGAREAIENIVPEVKDLNKTYQNRKALETAITEYLKGHPSLVEHPAMIGLAIMNDLGSHAGLNTGFHQAVPTALAYEMLSNPRIRAALALAKAGADTSKILGGIPQVAARTIPQIHLSTPIPQKP